MATGLKFKYPSIPTDHYLIVVWYENSAIQQEVDRFVYPPGAGAGEARGQNVLAPDGLKPVVYTFRFYSSAGGQSLDMFVDEWSVDASTGGTASFKTIWYVVDRGDGGTNPDWADPVSGTITLRDERLRGLEYIVFSRGTGARIPGIEITDRSDEGGGFDLNGGETFQSGDLWLVQVNQTVSANPTGTPAPLGEYDIMTIDNDLNMELSDLNKLIYVSGTRKVVYINVPVASSVSDHTKLKVVTHGFSGNNVVLNFGDTQVPFVDRYTTKVMLGRGELYECKWVGNLVYTIDYQGVVDLVGHTILADRKVASCEYADRTEYNIVDYPRLMAYLAPNQTCTYSNMDDVVTVTLYGISYEYPINRGKVAIDWDLGKFRMPDARAASFRVLGSFDGAFEDARYSQGPMGFMNKQLLQHTHGVIIKGRGFKNDNGNPVDLSKDGNTPWTFQTESAGGGLNVDDNFGKYAVTII